MKPLQTVNAGILPRGITYRIEMTGDPTETDIDKIIRLLELHKEFLEEPDWIAEEGKLWT